MKSARTWTSTVTDHEDFLEITITGQVSLDAVPELEVEVFALIKAKGVNKILVDVRDLEGRFGVTDAYERVQSYADHAPNIRTAVVDLPEHGELNRFYEDASYNVGRTRRFFTNLDEARAWLQEPPS